MKIVSVLPTLCFLLLGCSICPKSPDEAPCEKYVNKETKTYTAGGIMALIGMGMGKVDKLSYETKPAAVAIEIEKSDDLQWQFCNEVKKIANGSLRDSLRLECRRALENRPGVGTSK